METEKYQVCGFSGAEFNVISVFLADNNRRPKPHDAMSKPRAEETRLIIGVRPCFLFSSTQERTIYSIDNDDRWLENEQ